MLATLLVVGIRLMHLPFLWRLVAADMQVLRHPEQLRPLRRTMLRLWWRVGSPILCLTFFMSFFSTTAGLTFLDGRSLNELDTVGWGTRQSSQMPPLGTAFMTLPLSGLILGAIYGFLLGGLKSPKPEIFRRRSLACLFLGGGLLPRKQWRLESQADGRTARMPTPLDSGLLLAYDGFWCFFMTLVSLATFAALPIRDGASHWYVMVWALAVIHCVLTYSLVEPIRMLFVYVLHKRTFG